MKMKKDNKIVIVGLIIVVILGLIAFFTTRDEDSIDYSNMTNEEIAVVVEEEVNNMVKNDLGEMGERDRMEYYVSSFMKAIENEEYQEAYDMLYDEFKQNYFKTLADFENYVKTKFPSMSSMEYTNIERNGTVYVLWVTISNPLSGKDSEREMNFVIQENDLNDFDLSFSVI